MTPTLHPCGDSAISLQLGDTIDAGVNAQIIALAAALDADPVPGVRELVPTYRSLLVRYEPEVIRGAQLEAVLRDRFAALGGRGVPGRLWRVPVVYGGDVGQDLAAVAALKGLSPEAVIGLHSGAEYRVYMIGFAPGFAYLGGLPEVLHTPRLAKPRQLVPAGALGIGGQQASINSVAGPSGWRYIGWTPVRVFDPARESPFLLAAGDRVRFAPVDSETGAALAERAATGDALIVPEPLA